MANNRSIQILRGNNIDDSGEILEPGQPVYDLSTHYLRIGDGGAISATEPVKASYANSAGHADNADIATQLSSSAGNANTPIYFSNGKPVECGTNLRVNISGNATGLSVGTVGSVSKPVYFSGGKPVVCEGGFLYTNYDRTLLTSKSYSGTRWSSNTIIDTSSSGTDSRRIILYSNGLTSVTNSRFTQANAIAPFIINVSWVSGCYATQQMTIEDISIYYNFPTNLPTPYEGGKYGMLEKSATFRLYGNWAGNIIYGDFTTDAAGIPDGIAGNSTEIPTSASGTWTAAASFYCGEGPMSGYNVSFNVSNVVTSLRAYGYN